MRLINVQTFLLEEFFEPNVPKYLILSHTWGADEVTFQEFQKIRSIAGQTFDFEEANFPNTKGWRKIHLTARQAIKNQYAYIWIDTCCIDKTSSSELSEAINSMYAWYFKSEICYAYLADVSAQWAISNRESLAKLGNMHDELGEDDDLINGLFQSEFGKSRWFTRGWTLQELIAPHNVVFVASEFEHIGQKADMVVLLHLITKIDETILENQSLLKDCSSARKLSWAASRNTTRVEDRSYSLLGLLGIHMPLLYGEGHLAFRRLQEEILKTSSDQSILAWDVPENFDAPFDGSELNHLLAPNPEFFKHAGKIVCLDERPSRAHSLFNIGLRINAPFIVSDENVSIFKIGLRCRFEDDICGPIALIVRHEMAYHSPQPELYYHESFDVAQARIQDSYSNFLPVVSKYYKRLCVIPLPIYTSAPRLDVTLLTGLNDEDDSRLETPLAFVLVVKCPTQQEHISIEITESFPSRRFNSETRIMRFPRTKNINLIAFRLVLKEKQGVSVELLLVAGAGEVPMAFGEYKSPQKETEYFHWVHVVPNLEGRSLTESHRTLKELANTFMPQKRKYDLLKRSKDQSSPDASSLSSSLYLNCGDLSLKVEASTSYSQIMYEYVIHVEVSILEMN
jgi:Heterokaryon incompatibility protein (HET)